MRCALIMKKQRCAIAIILMLNAKVRDVVIARLKSAERQEVSSSVSPAMNRQASWTLTEKLRPSTLMAHMAIEEGQMR